MRYARHLITLFAVLAFSLLGLYLGASLARIADITELQAGLMTGAVITWAVFRIDVMVHAATDTTNPQD